MPRVEGIDPELLRLMVARAEHDVMLKACAHKKVYYSKDAALAGITKMERSWGYRMELYRCPYCDCWHLSRKKK